MSDPNGLHLSRFGAFLEETLAAGTDAPRFPEEMTRAGLSRVPWVC
jgi:hypothetical protein